MPSEATAETIAPKEHRSDSTLALSTPRVNIKIQVTRSESPNGEVQIRSTGAFNREILLFAIDPSDESMKKEAVS